MVSMVFMAEVDAAMVRKPLNGGAQTIKQTSQTSQREQRERDDPERETIMINGRKQLNRSHHQTHTRAGFPFLTDSDEEDQKKKKKKEREGHRETRGEPKTE